MPTPKNRLSIAIFFDKFRTVAALRHAIPDFSHSFENQGFPAVRNARSDGNGPQLRDGFAAAFDYDNAAFGSLSYKLRSMNVKFTDRRFPHETTV